MRQIHKQQAEEQGRHWHPVSRWRALSRNLKIVTMLLAVVVFNVVVYVPLHTRAAGAHMMLFWDPASGSVPSGWSLVTAFNGRFPRGESVANYGLTGGDDVPRTPTVASESVGPPSSTTNGNGATDTVASSTHTHPNPTVTVGSDSNGDIPAFRSLQLMQYSAGIPNIIPQGAIVMFDNGTIPSGFNRVMPQDNAMIRVDSTVTTGGNDTATNSVTVGPLSASTSATQSTATKNNGSPDMALPTHTHAAPPTGNTTATSTVPPYVAPLLAQATANTSSLTLDMVAMFDGDPGTGWAILSNSGGSYYQQFIRPAATVNLTSQGSATHTPPTYSVESGADQTASTLGTKGNGGIGNSDVTHTHTITVNFNSVSNLPPYFDVVIAQKISFTLQSYRWFAESGSQNVTDPWPAGAAIDIPQNTVITAIPPQYLAPINTNQLRLRLQILLSGQALPANSLTYKLQYKQGSDGSCTTGTWTDVDASGGAGVWTYGTNAVADGTTLTASQLTPASSVLQLFAKSASAGTNPNATAVGQTMEYDFLVRANNVADGSQYSFRILESTGTLLSLYTVCPTVVTRPGVSQEMRHGNFFQDGVEQGFEWAD